MSGATEDVFAELTVQAQRYGHCRVVPETGSSSFPTMVSARTILSVPTMKAWQTGQHVQVH
jgi:hypothetical protein